MNFSRNLSGKADELKDATEAFVMRGIGTTSPSPLTTMAHPSAF